MTTYQAQGYVRLKVANHSVGLHMCGTEVVESAETLHRCVLCPNANSASSMACHPDQPHIFLCFSNVCFWCLKIVFHIDFFQFLTNQILCLMTFLLQLGLTTTCKTSFALGGILTFPGPSPHSFDLEDEHQSPKPLEPSKPETWKHS